MIWIAAALATAGCAGRPESGRLADSTRRVVDSTAREQPRGPRPPLPVGGAAGTILFDTDSTNRHDPSVRLPKEPNWDSLPTRRRVPRDSTPR